MTQLKRELGLLQATAINMIDMIGIGPFVVLPLVIQMFGSPLYIWAWIAGALVSLVDALIWSELGTAFPKAGGSYQFLKEAYGPKLGRMMSFLLVWQTMIQAPLVIASGSIGFSQYLGFVLPLGTIEKKLVSGLVVIALTFLLYRQISSIGKIGVFLWTGVLGTMGWIIFSGFAYGENHIEWLPLDFDFNLAFFAVLGQASVKTIYSYLGYYNVCHLGAEIKSPEKNIPRSMFLSIAGIAALYMAMNYAVVKVIPWQEAQNSEFIVSSVIEKIYGHTAAIFATLMILWVAFASLFSVMLGYTRIPYAAAVDGQFFSVFGKLHPTKNFPHVALLFLGGVAFVFSLLFRLGEVISAILAMRIIVQFIGQSIGVILLRKRKINLSFKMPLYPVPIFLVIAIWIWIFISTGFVFAMSGLTVISLGIIVYMVKAKRKGEWPFEESVHLPK